MEPDMHFTTLDYLRFGVIFCNPPETPDYQLVMAEIERFLGQMRIRVAPSPGVYSLGSKPTLPTQFYLSIFPVTSWIGADTRNWSTKPTSKGLSASCKKTDAPSAFPYGWHNQVNFGNCSLGARFWHLSSYSPVPAGKPPNHFSQGKRSIEAPFLRYYESKSQSFLHSGGTVAFSLRDSIMKEREAN
ncbi:hypothetical protein U1Q18_041279 [Sarracenia purpurea var. burkii]